MDQAGQKLRAFDDSRAGTGEVRIRVHGINFATANRREFRPAGPRCQQRYLCEGLLKTESTGREDQNFRRPFQNLFPFDARGVRPRARQRVNAAGQFDHLRHPMPIPDKTRAGEGERFWFAQRLFPGGRAVRR